MKLTPEQMKKLELLKLQKEYREKLRYAFDAHVLDSRPTEKQLEIIKSTTNINYIVASNRSGKSQLGSRIVAWWFEENHPYMKRKEKWGDRPLTILMVGRVGEQMESELWANKLEPFLTPGCYKVVKSGNSISRIEHRENGNKIIFISHHDADQARQKAQAYTAQIVWLDEMPTQVGILNELRARVFDSEGYMYCTFTPLIRNQEIRKIVDNKSRRAKKWFISLFDNPKLGDKTKEEIIEEYRAMSKSESEFQARVYGKWMSADTAVFSYDSEMHWRKPEGYDPRIWPHVAVVDPAVSGTAGLTVYAREPKRDVWYCVYAKYVKGTAFSKMVPMIEELLQPFNITKRICDCNPSGFYKEAAEQGIKYQPVTDKSFNKENMIDACNDALANSIVYLSPGSEILVDELISCSRAEDNPDRIVKASKYHTADTFRYFIHLKPKFEVIKAEPKPEERLRVAWKEKLQSDKKRAIMEHNRIVRTRFRQFKSRRVL